MRQVNGASAQAVRDAAAQRAVAYESSTGHWFSPDRAVHFCSGTVGGAEWNGPAYDPQANLILIDEVDWCATVQIQKEHGIREVKAGAPWSRNAFINPYHTHGAPDSFGHWTGIGLYRGCRHGCMEVAPQIQLPILSGMTPTAGGVVFFGEMGGHFYALDSATGERLWSTKTSGAFGDGVIIYSVNGEQKVAVATGSTAILWPTEVVTGKIVILGLSDSSNP